MEKKCGELPRACGGAMSLGKWLWGFVVVGKKCNSYRNVEALFRHFAAIFRDSALKKFGHY